MSNKLISGKRTKKNISNNPVINKKQETKEDPFIDSLLNKKGNNRGNKNKHIEKKRLGSGNKSKKQQQMITNFHKAINSTNSDDIIVKMLDLKDDIVNFYGNLEKLIGSEMSINIRNQMSKDLQINNKLTSKQAMCPFCQENKSNCVILLCGHMLCHKCAKNINRCKFPCPKCKKPIKYIQFIVE